MKAIQEEQKGIEASAGKDHPEPNAIEKTTEDLYNDCKKMVDDAKSIGKDIEKARAGQSHEVGKALKPIGERLLDLDKRILILAQKLEELGQKVLKHGEDLRAKEKFPPELKAKFDKVGKKIENIGGKLKNIGANFCVIGDKMMSIGNRIGGEDGPKLVDFAKQLKDLCHKVKEKGGSVENLGVQIQKLEPNMRDAGTDKDLEDIQNALGKIGNDLESILKVIFLIFISFCKSDTCSCLQFSMKSIFIHFANVILK